MQSTLFISDLHLSSTNYVLTKAFIALMQAESTKQLEALYIVGDFFDLWVGDDDNSKWLDPIVASLNTLRSNGAKIYLIKGNRDFMLGQAFCDRFGGQLLDDKIILPTSIGNILLEHGDQLCTDDIQYQKFRHKSRNPQWQSKMLRLPLWLRKLIAHYIRWQSYQHAKHLNSSASLTIMDVNSVAVQQAFEKANASIILHGHTHLPNTHTYDNNRLRVVLGDWREQSREAVIARLTVNGISLETYTF